MKTKFRKLLEKDANDIGYTLYKHRYHGWYLCKSHTQYTGGSNRNIEFDNLREVSEYIDEYKKGDWIYIK